MQKVLLSKDWLFRREAEQDYVNIDLPHDYSITMPRSANSIDGQYTGYFPATIGHYLKYFVPSNNLHYILDVDGSYMCTDVYFNEVHMTMHPYGYSPFLLDLTDLIRPGISNKLMFVVNALQPSCRWYSGAGLYRDVYLWTGGDIRIEPWNLFITTPDATKEKATVHVNYEISADYAASILLRAAITDAQGCVVASAEIPAAVSAGKTGVVLDIPVANPNLWDTEHPYLYSLHTDILADGNITDTADTSFGIRTISFCVENGFCLNGVSMKMRGGCIHHDHGVLGAADYPTAIYRKLSRLKAAGFNAIRSSHNPPSLQVLEACDKLGLLLMDEAFDCWEKPKRALGYNLWFNDWYERDITAMVKRDRNHPCVMSYSVGNEIREMNGIMQGDRIARNLANAIRRHDTTRPVTGAAFGMGAGALDVDPQDYKDDYQRRFLSQSPEDPINHWGTRTAPFFAEMDICGYNYLYDRYASDHEKFPERIIWGSETVVINFYDSWKATLDNSFVLGDFTWTAYDNLGEVGAGRSFWQSRDGENPPFLASYPWRSCYQGDLNLIGIRRPQSYYRETIWLGNTEPRIFTTHPIHNGDMESGTGWHWHDVLDSWTFDDNYLGAPVKCEVYTDGDEVEWFLNGRSLGRTMPEKVIATMEIPYERGELSVIAYKNGVECGRSFLQTAGTPSQLIVTAETSSFQADNRELCYFDVIIADENGARIPDAQNELTCIVDGGELLGFFSGDPANEDQYGSNRCHAFEGSALAIVRTRTPGEVTVTIGAAGLHSGNCTVTAK